MGLRRCFRANDTLRYPEYEKPNPAAGTKIPNIVAWAYNNWLLTAPRICTETLGALSQQLPEYYAAYNTGGYSPGVIFPGVEENLHSPYIFTYFSVMSCAYWPSWGSRSWKFDDQFGNLLTTQAYGSLFGSGGTGYGRFAYEPSGFLWTFAGHPFINDTSAALVDQTTFTPTDTTLINVAEWEAALGRGLTTVSDFNVDRQADRVFIRWSSNSGGHVEIYRLSTKEKIGDMYVPNASSGIVLTADGWVYLVDNFDWICVYDYDGRFYNAFKNPRREAYYGGSGGVAMGWDPFMKRLLFAGCVADGTNGQSRVRVEGFYPTAEASDVTLPLPRSVPRVGRKLTIFSHLSGEGLEPLAARSSSLQVGGVTKTTGATDVSGDTIFQLTPASTADLAVSITVDATIPIPPAPEPDKTSPDRSLVVRLNAVQTEVTALGYAANTALVTVENPVGACDVYIAEQPMLGANRVVKCTGPDANGNYHALIPVIPHQNGSLIAWFLLVAFAQDSTGNVGQSNSMSSIDAGY